jgi:hypothetical protein
MGHVAVISQPFHNAVENVCRLLQTKFLCRARIAEAKSWDTRNDNVESLLGASTEAWQAMRIGERVDDTMYLDERAWPRVTKEKRNSILMLRTFVDEMNSKRFGGVGGGHSWYLNSGTELRQGSIEVCFLRPPVIMFEPIERVSM